MYLIPKIIVIMFAMNYICCAPDPSKISSKLRTILHTSDKVDIFIKLADSVNGTLQLAQRTEFTTREERLEFLHAQLLRHTERTQKNILEYLKSQTNKTQHLKVRRFWATNQILVKGATREIVNYLDSRFQSDIQTIYPNEIVAHIPVEIKQNTTKVKVPQSLQNLTWGLKKIQAKETWEALGLLDVDDIASPKPNIRIATIDTGVRRTHIELKSTFVGRDYGWFDPTIGDLEPNDRMGHGSHTTATIVGQTVGVDPWARWMTCRACPTLGCSLDDLLACGEFFLCPTLADGSSPRCDLAPHLVSNSWSGGQGLDWYDDIINAWHVAGIIPVFSIGNMGNAFCGSANYPGDLPNVIAVGSTTEDDTLSWFSSIGPTMTGGPLIKPDVVAPGSDILSATNTADDDYELMSGTSMACPHVSGIVALLLTQNPQITFDEVKAAIIEGVQRNLQSPNMTCQDIPDTKFPNHVFGYGRANALQSVQRAITLGRERAQERAERQYEKYGAWAIFS